MDEYYFSLILDNDRSLVISPLTDRHVENAGEDVKSSIGYFLYESSLSEPDCVTVLAQLTSENAARELSRLLNME